jgi:hypothetical protein
MKGWNLFFGNRAQVLVLMMFSQLDEKKVDPPVVPSAATKHAASFIPGLIMLGVFFMMFTAGFSNNLLGELRLLRSEVRLLRSEVSLLRLAAEKIAGQ